MHQRDAILLSSPRRGARTPRRRLGLAFLGGGAALAAFVALVAAVVAAAQRSSTTIGSVRVWAADRDAHRIVGLDQDLFLVREIPAAWPLALEVRDDGGLWILRSGNASSSFGMRLTCLAANGAVLNEMYLESCPDLALLGGRDALVIESGTGAHGLDRVWRLWPDGHAEVLREDAALACLCVSRGELVLGSRDGRLVRVPLDSPAKPRVEHAFQASFGDLVPGPESGSVFALDVSPAHQLYYLDSQLVPRWTANVGLDAHELAAVPDEERVWLGSESSARARRFGPGGALELDLVLAQLGLSNVVTWRGGGALFSSPGAVLRVDVNGQPQPGQGGFQALSDLARVP